MPQETHALCVALYARSLPRRRQSVCLPLSGLERIEEQLTACSDIIFAQIML